MCTATSSSDRMADAEATTDEEQERHLRGDETVAQPLVENIDARQLSNSIDSACAEEKRGTEQEKSNKNHGGENSQGVSSEEEQTKENIEGGEEETKSGGMIAPNSDDPRTPDGMEQRLTNLCRELEGLAPAMQTDANSAARIVEIFEEIHSSVERCHHQAVVSSGLERFIQKGHYCYSAHPDFHSGFSTVYYTCRKWLRQVVQDAPNDAQPKSSGLSSQAQELENNNERSETEEANSKKETSMLRDSTTKRGTSSREISYVSSTDLM